MREVMGGSERGMESKPRDIRERSIAYAVRAIRLYRALEGRRDGAARVVGKQFLRSATSIGANIQEAQSAESRADFIHKYGIAQKEAKESLYWLQLIRESELLPKERLTDISRETEELYAVITAIIVNAKRKAAAQRTNSGVDTPG
jgi:four helix bundle protein